MQRLLKKTIEAELAKADELVARGAPTSGAVRLGALWAASSGVTPEQAYLEGAIRSRLGQIDLHVLRRDLRTKADSLRRILSGDNLIFEDIVLGLTLRIEIALLDFCMNQFSGIEGSGVEIKDCDAEFRDLSANAKSRTAYRSALVAIEKNWRGRVRFDVDRIGVGELFREQ